MAKIVVLNAGLYAEVEQLEVVVDCFDSVDIKHYNIDCQRMDENDWDEVLSDVLDAETVVTL